MAERPPIERLLDEQYDLLCLIAEANATGRYDLTCFRERLIQVQQAIDDAEREREREGGRG